MQDLTEARKAGQDARFRAGVAEGCALLRQVLQAAAQGTTSAKAEHRVAGQQERFLPLLLATLGARPELLDGIDAVLTDALGEGLLGNAPSLDHLAELTCEEWAAEAPPTPPASNVVPFRAMA